MNAEGKLDNYNFFAKLFGMKEEKYPNWYGIKGIKFIFVNSYSDPLIEYKGIRFSSYLVEDTMWARYTEEGNSDVNNFDNYMFSHTDEVYELCNLAIASIISIKRKMSFIDDKEKMFDFKKLSKEDFLFSYSYLTEEEYDATKFLVERDLI